MTKNQESLEAFDMLRVFSIIREHGSRLSNGDIEYKGITAFSDQDGYSVTLTDGCVSVSLGFHNTKRFTVKKPEDLEQFMLKINAILDL